MLGRMDIKSVKCSCTKKKCKKCNNIKEIWICQTCGEQMPCSGTDKNIFDQSYCNKIKGE